MKPAQFNPDHDIPSLAGKTILITGGTAGVGSQTIFELYKHSPKQIIFTGRNQKGADIVISKCTRWRNSDGRQRALSEPKLTFVSMNMTDLAAVALATTEIREEAQGRIDIAILNAGVMAISPGLTKDGYEVQFGICHLAHALIVFKLLPILDVSHARVLNITSIGYQLAPAGGTDFEGVRTIQKRIFGSWYRYGQAKLANVLFGREIARRYPNITSIIVHPGVSYTGLVTSLSFGKRIFVYATTLWQRLSDEEGAYNHLWAATAAEVQSGQMYEPVGNMHNMNAKAKDDALALRLWEWSNEEVAGWI